MLTKWIWDRRLRPVLAGVLVLGLAIGLLASGLPAAQRSARIGEIAAEGLRPLSTLSPLIVPAGRGGGSRPPGEPG